MKFSKVFELENDRQLLFTIDDWDEETDGSGEIHALRMTCWFGSVKATGAVGPLSLLAATQALDKANEDAAKEAHDLLAAQLPENIR